MTERTQAAVPPADAQPDPEPIAPSLPEPDRGVYHHEVDPAEEDDRA